MISILLIDKKNKLDINDYKKIVNSLNQDVETFYCSSKKITSDFVKNYIYEENENSEKIINSLVRECMGDVLVIVRDINRLNKLPAIINKYTESNQIVCLKQQTSKFKNFLYEIGNNTAGKIYMHNLKPIDYGIILYGKVATKVLVNINLPSVLMRTNNFEGINYVYLDGGENYKFGYNKTKESLRTLVPLAIGILMIVLNLAINFKLFITLNIIYYIVAIFLIFLSIMFGLRWIVFSILGDNITEKAELKLDNDMLINLDSTEEANEKIEAKDELK